VDHVADVPLVDAHPEGDGCDTGGGPVVEEVLVRSGARGQREPSKRVPFLANLVKKKTIFGIKPILLNKINLLK
jgi:hypothetical protein